ASGEGRGLECNKRREGDGCKFVVAQHKIILRSSHRHIICESGRKKPSAPECGLSVSANPVDIIRPPSYLSRNLASRTFPGVSLSCALFSWAGHAGTAGMKFQKGPVIWSA